MKAILQDRYGPPDEVLSLGDVDAPVAEEAEVLIRIHAAAIHPGDYLEEGHVRGKVVIEVAGG